MALEKATITNTVTREAVQVLFNPADYELNREINYAQVTIPGLSSPLLQFVAGNLQTLEMELFLDSYEAHSSGSRILTRAQEDVRRLTSQVTNLMNIEPSTHAPPVLIFTWASLAFRCVLSRVHQRFVMFLDDGTPVRALLSVVFSEFSDLDLEAKEVKRETSDFTKRRLVHQGDTLAGITAEEYGDPRLWRVVALKNRIDNPRRLTPGTELVLPHLPYRDPDTGEVYS